LLLVGNDIVDLSLLECQGKSGHTRFMQRVFSRREQQAILSSADTDRMLWLHWAAKEAAYKIISKLQPRPVFAHPRFEATVCYELSPCPPKCTCRQTFPLSVTYEAVRVELQAVLTHAWVHVYGALDGDAASVPAHRVMAGVSTLRPLPEQTLEILSSYLSPAEMESVHSQPSALVRLHAKARLAQHLHVSPERLQIVRPGPPGDRQPPRLLVDGRHADDVDLSLSHHGNHIAWAFVSAR